MISKLFKPAQQFITDNTTVILSGVGVAGVVGTAVLTGKATVKAVELVQTEAASRVVPGTSDEKDGTYPPIPKADIVKLVWTQYVPAAGCATVTILAIIFAHRISAKEAAALAAAYSISESKFTEYKEKVQEKLGLKKEEAVRAEVAQDQVTKTPPGSDIILTGNGDVICLDAYSGRYFRSNCETVRRAVNDLNADMINNMTATLSEFYQSIGLPRTGFSDDVGWTPDDLLDISVLSTLTPDNQPAIVFEFTNHPKPLTRPY